MERWVDRLAGGLKVLSAVCLAGMMLLTCADVVGRAVGRPILGAVEITGLLATLLLAFSMPYTHRVRAHVGVELLVMRLGPRARAAVEACTGALGTALFAVIAWRSWIYAGQMRASGEVSMTLQLPVYVVIYLIALSFAVLAAVQLADVVRCARVLAGRGGAA